MDLYNQDAEAATLAGILRHPDAYWAINSVGLKSDDFMGVENKKVMKAIESVAVGKQQPDMPLVVEALRGNDETTTAYIGRLLGVPASVAQAQTFAKTVRGLSISRQLASAGATITSIAREARSDYEEALSSAEGQLRKIRDTIPAPDRSPDPADILRRLATGVTEDSIPIHFAPTLNDISGGLIPGHLWVIGGFSSTGKSAVACNIIDDVTTARRWAGLISTEMTQENYMQRMLALLSGIPFRDIRDNVIVGSDNVTAFRAAEKRLSTMPVRIFDTVYRIGDIRLQAQLMKETTGLDVLLVDFMQNVSGSAGDFSFTDMTEITLELQRIAKDLRITVIAFSQLSNQMAQWDAQGGDDNFYGFKGSGAIKDAADFAIMLKRDRIRQSEQLDFHVMKNRHGELRVVGTHIDLPTGRIEEIGVEGY